MLVRKEELLILQELQAKCQHLASRLELMLVKVLKNFLMTAVVLNHL